MLKEAVPLGTSKQIVIEVKTNKAALKDLNQIKSYIDEIGNDCVGGILIAKDFNKKVINNAIPTLIIVKTIARVISDPLKELTKEQVAELEGPPGSAQILGLSIGKSSTDGRENSDRIWKTYYSSGSDITLSFLLPLLP